MTTREKLEAKLEKREARAVARRESARDKFNIDYPPVEHIFCSLPDYYFAKGRMDALVDKMQ